MEELALHILDVAENAIIAGARHIEIQVKENKESNIFKIEIIDNGKGMNPETLQKATDPFFTSRTTRKVGLGLSLLSQAAQAANGLMEIHSAVGQGTHVSATFQLNHIDLQPLGNMAETVAALISRNPDIDIKYIFNRDEYQFTFSTTDIRKKIAELPINSTAILSFIKQYISENTDSIS